MPILAPKQSQRALFVVSTGRCGTTRLAELIRLALPIEAVVLHQVPGARVANIIAHAMLCLNYNGRLREKAAEFIFGKLLLRRAISPLFVSTDPLTAMHLPLSWIRSHQVKILHLKRDENAFARSFRRYTRTRWKSFLAHNFVPFWQPGLWPLQNMLGLRLHRAYLRVSRLKKEFFRRTYESNPHYQEMDMEKLFQGSCLTEILEDFFGDIVKPIAPEALQQKSNISRP